MIPEQRDEPSDATRFATRPKQRKAELANATDNTLAKLRAETVASAIGQLLDGADDILHAADVAIAHRFMEEGMWRQWVADDRTLDPESVAEQFARAEREHAAAVHNRAVLRIHGITT